jgi:hypothetical protein
MSDISELFERDPLGLTDADLDKIIARMREAQAQYELGAPAKTPKAVTKAPKSTKTLDLLKDLGLT